MSNIPEEIWRKAERNMIERERLRLVANGTISDPAKIKRKRSFKRV